MTPTERIYNWFLELPTEVQDELCAIIGPFHYDALINSAADDLTAVQHFLRFLQTKGMPLTEVVRRSLFTCTLVDYAMTIKTIAQYWQEAERNAQRIMEHEALSGIDSEAKEHFMKKLIARKQMWQLAASRWKALKAKHLNPKKIAAFEQAALFGAVKNGCPTPFDILDIGQPMGYMLCLWPKPEVALGFMLIREKISDLSNFERFAYLGAPYTLKTLISVRYN